MPTENELKISIQTALTNFEKDPLAKAAKGLLSALGYQSKKTLSISPNTAEQFQKMFDPKKRMKPEAKLDEWKSVDLLFQLTGDEITESLKSQGQLFVNQKVEQTQIESYLFFAIVLKDKAYSRKDLASITREVNKCFKMPALIIFRHGQTITFSIIARRINKKDESKDVLEKVTLIKDIRFNENRPHIEILNDLALTQLAQVHSVSNFVELQRAWEKTLDINELNKKFYREVADWYFWAISIVNFPKDAETEMSVIRLITRLIFVWFIKEKGLVPDALVDERKLKDILNYNDPKKSNYYKAILQNLFFATLNTEMGEARKFRGRNKNPNGLDQHHGIPSLYRYEDYFKSPQETLKLFSVIPFLNGGLFECLDRPEEKVYIDGFSDIPKNQPVVPDDLFFGKERMVDLSEAYGDEHRNHEKVLGLIHIFNHYKFTVEENTPIEEEIALDPELLGKVFENLLAAYNPETGTTARKQTGSFYTPREIVNYMVDEALLAYLESNLQGVKGSQAKLRQLLAYNTEAAQFTEEEKTQLIAAIDKMKVLDPACGSGAFPMGVLHKLVFLLGKLDPKNEHWKGKQISKADEIQDSVARGAAIQSIEQVFTDNFDDYGRKLYLIENCIYGVDIQPIAVQIAKLRFFISLVVDQKANIQKSNLGIQPLPNLETKFVAANTLIGIQKPKAGKETALSFGDMLYRGKQDELKEVRRNHFSARTSASKRKYRALDKKLRAEISELLKKDGWGSETAQQLAGWDPYNQNSHADFFDPEWMFGFEKGFDIVIGNPPYGAELDAELKKQYRANFNFVQFKIDSFVLFMVKALELLRSNGECIYIIPNTFLNNYFLGDFRKYILENYQIRNIVNFQDSVFEAVVHSCIFGFVNNRPNESSLIELRRGLDLLINKIEQRFYLQTDNHSIDFRNQLEISIFEKVKSDTVRFEDIIDLRQAIKSGNDKEYIKDNQKSRKWKSILRGKDVNRYSYTPPGLFIYYGDHLACPRDPIIFEQEHILIRETGSEIIATLDPDRYYIMSSLYCGILINVDYDLRFILGLLNSKLFNYLMYKINFENTVGIFTKAKIYHYNQLPIKQTPRTHQDKMVLLVRKILGTKRANPQADTSKVENEIDQLVYQLYGLTEEEIKIVEGKH